MKRFTRLVLSLFGLMILSGVSQHSCQAAAPAPVGVSSDGWRQLFDGKSLSGWHNFNTGAIALPSDQGQVSFRNLKIRPIKPKS